ncbi:MAG: lipid II flippase MurJ, partial [Verrucomicrobiota bacterium]
MRDILIARFVGTGLVGDAFFAAFRFPNLFRRIFGEGAFNAAFVPLFGKRVAKDREGAMAFASNAFSTLFVVLGLFTVVAIPAMPWIMKLVVPGFEARAEVVLGKEAQEVEVKTRGARAVFFVLQGEGKVVIEEPAYEREVRKSLGSLLGQKDETKEVGVEAGENLEFGIEGAVWEGAKLVSKEGETLIEISRPKGKAGQGLSWFTAKISGEGTVKVYRNHPETFEMTVLLARIMFVYLLCMALAAHLSGVLNTFQVFGMPAAAPIILNVVFLLGLMGVWLLGWAKGQTLAISVAIAGFLQLGALWWTCWRKGAPVKLRPPQMDGEMKKLFGLMGPGVASASVQQINLLI